MKAQEPKQEIKIGGTTMYLNIAGHWEVDISKGFDPQQLPSVRIKQPVYRDQPEIKVLGDLELTYKKQYRTVIRTTVLQIVKFLDNL